MNTGIMSRRRSSLPSTLTAINDFERIMLAIFTMTGLPLVEDGPRHAYRVRVDDAFDLNLFPDPHGNLVIVGTSLPVDAEIGPVHLLRLLQLNTYFPSTHQITIGFLPESRRMQAWLRHPMQRMKDKDAIRMLKLMANAVSHINFILAEQHHHA